MVRETGAHTCQCYQNIQFSLELKNVTIFKETTRKVWTSNKLSKEDILSFENLISR